MESSKNILREETINFAIEISDICDNIKGWRNCDRQFADALLQV